MAKKVIRYTLEPSDAELKQGSLSFEDERPKKEKDGSQKKDK